MPRQVQQAAARWLPRGAKAVKVGASADAISPTITQVTPGDLAGAGSPGGGGGGDTTQPR